MKLKTLLIGLIIYGVNFCYAYAWSQKINVKPVVFEGQVEVRCSGEDSHPGDAVRTPSDVEFHEIEIKKSTNYRGRNFISFVPTYGDGWELNQLFFQIDVVLPVNDKNTADRANAFVRIDDPSGRGLSYEILLIEGSGFLLKKYRDGVNIKTSSKSYKIQPYKTYRVDIFIDNLNGKIVNIAVKELRVNDIPLTVFSAAKLESTSCELSTFSIGSYNSPAVFRNEEIITTS